MAKSKDIIQLLKDNWVPFGGWPDFYGKELGEEMQEKARELQGAKKDPPIFEAYAPPPHGWLGCHIALFADETTYRLRADYEEEPEIREMEIAANNSNCLCMYNDEGQSFGSVAKVYERPDFAGFRFKSVFGDKIYTDLWLNLDVECNGNYKITHASHVLFRK